MRKILAIILVGIFVVAIPSASSMRLPTIAQRLDIFNGSAQTTDIPEWADGNISGVYALKNETGYEVLGTIEGYYNRSYGASGYYAGTWLSLDETQSGEFAGWFFYSITLGHYNTTGSEDEGGYLGLFRINETEQTIQSIAIVSNGEDHFIRYSLCTYTEFE